MGIRNVQFFNQNLLGGANEGYPFFRNSERKISYGKGICWTPPEGMETFKGGLKKYAKLFQRDKYYLGFTPISKESYEKMVKENDPRLFLYC